MLISLSVVLCKIIICFENLPIKTSDCQSKTVWDEFDNCLGWFDVKHLKFTIEKCSVLF